MTATALELRDRYDAQLRGEAELHRASSIGRVGPLWWARFGDRGFVTYRSLEGVDGDELDRLIALTVAHYRDDTDCRAFEWKTRGHDEPADLTERLVAAGPEPEAVETVMIGRNAAMAGDVQLPAGLSLRRAGDSGDLLADLKRATALQDAVFGGGGPTAEELADDFARNPDGLALWMVEAEYEVVGAGRLERVVGTDFAGLWGGAVAPEWRGRGVYRALTAARARAALMKGATLLQSDCTAMSRPILERNGFIAVTTTTPYIWTRPNPEAS